MSRGPGSRKREERWLVQGNGKNEWFPASDLDNWMCENVSKNKKNIDLPKDLFPFPVWVAQSNKGSVLLCSKEHETHLPFGQLYIWNLSKSTKRYVWDKYDRDNQGKRAPNHDGAEHLKGGTEMVDIPNTVFEIMKRYDPETFIFKKCSQCGKAVRKK
jgi:hypothetical protein